ncbi:MAG: AAA family ATPase, partial [Nitrososphaerota archaeon]|nr:AAA family ATPase [Nitrososphaerota archaeon]
MEYNPRKIEEKLDQWLNRKEVIIIRGPRQSGKTTLLLHLKDKYGGHYVTLEDEDA